MGRCRTIPLAMVAMIATVASCASFVVPSVVGAAAAAAASPATTPAPPPAPATWARQPIASGPAPTARDGVLGYDSASGRLLMFNGIFTGAPANDLWSFDPVTNAWRLVVANGTPPLASKVQRDVAWNPDDRRFLAIDATGSTTNVFTYDTTTNAWTTVQSVGGPLGVSAAGVVWDTFAHRLLVFGGCYGIDICSRSNALWSYDPASQTWSLLAPNGPVPPAIDGTITVWDSTDHAMLVVAGGADTWSWDSPTHVWTRLAVTNAGGGPLLSTRQWASGVWDPVDRELLVFGGAHFTPGVGFTPLDELWVLHPDTRSWAQLHPGGARPPANAVAAATFVDAAVWDPTISSMRLLALDPTSTSPSTALWNYHPAPPVVGGGSFTLRLGSTGPSLSWQTGDSQTGYRVMRRVGPSTTVVGSTLPAGSTTVVDPGPPGGSACYQLATLGGSAIVATSGLLCALSGTAPAPGDPAHLSISVDRAGRVTLQWDPPTAPGPGFSGYLVVRADQGSVAFPGLVTHSTSDPIVGPSCWYVRAYVGPTVAGQTPVVCAVPGLAAG